MSSVIVLIVPLLALLAVLGIMLIVVPRRRALVAVDAAAFPRLEELRRLTGRVRVAAFVLGLIAAAVVATQGSLGVGLVLAPAAFAAVQILGVLTTDQLSRDAARTPGEASLEVRRLRDFSPRGLGRVTALLGVLLAGYATWAGSQASADARGRVREYAYPCGVGCDGAASPWPGSFYTGPLSIALVAVVLLAVVAAVLTVRRPRNGGDAEIVRVDDIVRRRLMESIIGSVGLALSVSLTAVALMVAGVSRAIDNSTEAHWPILWSWLVVVLGLGSALYYAVVLVLPGASRDRRFDVSSDNARSES